MSRQCNNCEGLDSCNKYCALHAGRALVNFLQQVDMIETKIGELTCSKAGGQKDLIYSGHQIWELASPSWIITKVPTTLDASNKFNTIFEYTPIQLVKNYCGYMGLEETDTKMIVEALSRLNSNKLLLLPFKPHTECKIDVNDEYLKEKNVSAEINYIKWETNQETYKLDATVGIKLLGTHSNHKIIRCNLEDYLNKFSLSLIYGKEVTLKKQKKYLQITNHGMFRPIEFKVDKSVVALDGTYAYITTDCITRIIGKWGDNGKLELSSSCKGKIKEMLDDIAINVVSHKRYIAPYLLYGANKIE